MIWKGSVHHAPLVFSGLPNKTSLKHGFCPKRVVDGWFWQELLFYGLLTRYDKLWGRILACLILCRLWLVCLLSQHKGCACCREVMTHFMPIQTPMCLNTTPTFLKPSYRLKCELICDPICKNPHKRLDCSMFFTPVHSSQTSAGDQRLLNFTLTCWPFSNGPCAGSIVSRGVVCSLSNHWSWVFHFINTGDFLEPLLVIVFQYNILAFCKLYKVILCTLRVLECLFISLISAVIGTLLNAGLRKWSPPPHLREIISGWNQHDSQHALMSGQEIGRLSKRRQQR